MLKKVTFFPENTTFQKETNELFERFVTTEFYVSRKNFWGKIFLLKKFHFLGFFGTWVKKLWPGFENYSYVSKRRF